MDAFLASDTEREKIVDVDAYLSAILRTFDHPIASELESINQSVGFKIRLDNYKKNALRGGKDCYPTFVDLANYAIAQMVEKGISANECFNEHTHVLGSLATRMPSVIGVKTGAVELWCQNGKGKELEESEASELTRRALNPAFAWSKQRANPLIQTPKNQSLAALTSGSQSVSSSVAHLRRSFRLASGSRASSHHNNQIATSAPSISTKRSLPHGGDGDDAPLAKKAKLVQKDHGTQCASYALEMFNGGGGRTHVIRAFIIDDKLQLCLYTRSCPCRTHSFSIIFEPLMSIHMLLAFSTLSISQWGMFDKAIPRTLSTLRLSSPDTSSTTPGCEMYVGQILTLNGIEYEVLEILAFPDDLVGRGTSVLRVRSRHPKLAERNQVVNLSSRALSLITEKAKVIRSAREIPEASEEHAWVSRHLPNTLGYGEVVADFSFGELFDDQSLEAKHFRYITAEELFPITNLTNPRELAKSFKDIILCHQWLVIHAKVVHRDINVNNLMYRIVDDKACGVLNDYDLTYYITGERDEASSKHRTGTKPFIALDLLRAVAQIGPDLHYVRYDLESFMYVFAWIVCRFQDKKEIENPPLGDWMEGSVDTVRKTKRDWLADKIKFTSQYESIKDILYDLRGHVRNGDNVKRMAVDYTERKNLEKLTSPSGQPFDDLTLDGNVTYSNFIAAFDLD